MNEWIKVGGWHHRYLADGTFLAVSLHAKGVWQWRRHVCATGVVIASGSGITAASAMSRADKTLAETYGQVAA